MFKHLQAYERNRYLFLRRGQEKELAACESLSVVPPAYCTTSIPLHRADLKADRHLEWGGAEYHHLVAQSVGEGEKHPRGRIRVATTPHSPVEA
jgi:hypothetical protein